MQSLPAIVRLDYLDTILLALKARASATVDDVRIAIGRKVEDLALLGHARQTRDWRHPLAYRDTAVDCLRELMRWSLVEPTPLADSAEGFERIRHLPIRLTSEGDRVATIGAAQRREIFGSNLLVHYPLFRDLLNLLELNDLLIPELSDATVKACFADVLNVSDDQDGWDRVAAACDSTLQVAFARARLLPPPATATLAEGIGRYVRARFVKRTPRNAKEVTGAVNKGIAQAILKNVGFRGDWNSYDRCLRWGRDLYLTNDGRHVFGVPGWLAWSASKVVWSAGSFIIERRGFSRYQELVRAELAKAYRAIADARQSVAVQVPLIPIYEVRETAAFGARVCDEVVDRVLVAMGSERNSGEIHVQFHLGDLRDFVPSARPFRSVDGKRYFYVSMHQAV